MPDSNIISDSTEFAERPARPAASRRWDNASDFIAAAMEAAVDKFNLFVAMLTLVEDFLVAVRNGSENLDDDEKVLLDFALRVEDDNNWFQKDDEYYDPKLRFVERAICEFYDQIMPLFATYQEELDCSLKARLADLVCEGYSAILNEREFRTNLESLLSTEKVFHDAYQKHDGEIIVVVEK